MTKARKIPIATDTATPSFGTHSQAVRAGGLLFVTGQTGRSAEGGLVEGLEEQVRRATENVEAILKAAGCGLGDIVKVTLLMERIEDFKAIDEIYAAWLPPRDAAPYPARTACGGVALPHGALLMLDVVALCPD